jgi:hypothetical protein
MGRQAGRKLDEYEREFERAAESATEPEPSQPEAPQAQESGAKPATEAEPSEAEAIQDQKAVPAVGLNCDGRAPLAAAAAESSPHGREIRAVYTTRTVRVYQAYNNEIADAALKHQRFVDPWKPGRMTWVKPSAIWMGYRCGWSQKDKNQARVLAVDLHREAFDFLLTEARLAKCQDEGPCDVVVQWDPERGLGGPKGKDAFTHSLGFRSLQMGIRGEMTKKFASNDFIAHITDVTHSFQDIGRRLELGDIDGASDSLPKEEVYPLPADLAILQNPGKAPPLAGNDESVERRGRSRASKEATSAAEDDRVASK